MKASLFNFVGEFSSILEEIALQVEDLLIYLLTNKTPTIVIHPVLVEETEGLKGLPTKSYKSTALRKFPKKEENGKLMSNYGYAYTFQTNSELEGMLQRIIKVMKGRSLV